MKKKWLISLTAAVSLTAGAAGGIYFTQDDDLNQEQAGGQQAGGLEKVQRAYDLIRQQYVEQVEDVQLVEGAIQGMLGTLKDPYTVYMDKAAAEQFNEALDSSFEGIGTEIGMEDNRIIIISPYKDSPAEKAGLKPRDELVKVNGESVTGLSLEETRQKILGRKGTAVKLEIRREGAARPVVVDIVRAEIPLETVYSSIKEDRGKKAGYMEITSFSEDTAEDFKTQLNSLEQEGIEGLVIDVRGNPGGLLSSVKSIAEELVTKDKPFVQIEERTGRKEPFYTERTKKKEYPIAVLMDNGSASASEILAGALKEAGGYDLIGEKSFGKGTVQQAVPLGDGSNIKITLYKWLTPDGNWIHQKGIEPTVQVSQPEYFNAHLLSVKKTYVKDMTDEQIKNAQEILSSLGFETGRADGYFDIRTEIAMKAFQRYHKLEPTGGLTPETAAKLMTAVQEKIIDEKNDAQLRAALKLVTK